MGCCHKWGSRAYGEYLCGSCGHRLLWTPEPGVGEERFCDALYLDKAVFKTLTFQPVKPEAPGSLWEGLL